MRKSKLIWVAVLAVLVLAPAAAFANLSAVGPVVPYTTPGTHTGNGFPHYYVDSLGQAADIQIPPFGDGLGLTTPTMIFAPVITNGALLGYTPQMIQFSQDIGFDVECFYYYMQPNRNTFDSIIDPVGHGNGGVNIVIGLEAGFATILPFLGGPENGQQATFQRIRFNWKNAPPGNYRFTHPYGVLNMIVPVGSTGLKVTTDFPAAVAGAFAGPLTGPIDVFCQQVNPPPLTLPTDPPGFNQASNWYGDGFQNATFTGSTTGFNQFKFEAFLPGTLTPNPLFTDPVTLQLTNTVTTNTAVISGHKFVLPKKGKIGGMIDLLLLD